MRLVRANQVSEVCRDAGHMFAYGVNFSQASSQNVLVQLTQGLNMTANGGKRRDYPLNHQLYRPQRLQSRGIPFG